MLRRAYLPGADPGINDSLVRQQGPNYALPKRVHRWRATLARDGGATVSINVAPPSRTRSVVKNRALAAAYAGAHRFGVEGSGRSENRWTSPDIARYRWTLAPSLAPRDLVSNANVRKPDATFASHPSEAGMRAAAAGRVARGGDDGDHASAVQVGLHDRERQDHLRTGVRSGMG